MNKVDATEYLRLNVLLKILIFPNTVKKCNLSISTFMFAYLNQLSLQLKVFGNEK